MAQQKPKLDDVLRSISESSRGTEREINWTPFLLLIIGIALMYVAVKHWNTRQQKPKILSSHSKLMKEIGSVSNVSPKTLKSLESLAHAQGMSSPLVAMLCPSAITTLAKNVKTESERNAVNELAREVLRP